MLEEMKGLAVDKTRAAVKDLYSRILVAIRSAETISNKIEKLRDDELMPQVNELLQGMMKTWKIMLESHEIQNKIIQEVKLFTCPSYGKFCNESHRRATLQLETELLNWRACLTEYITAQRAYIKALHAWLAKFVVPEVEFYSRGSSSTPCYSNGPPLLVICRDWLASMDKLPDKKGEEQQQKRKVDDLSRELDRKILAFQKIENNRFELKLTDQNTEQAIEHRDEHLKEKKDTLDNFRKRVDMEKEKHHNCVQETERIALNGFQTGFGKVFESMTEFSNAALSMYSDLLNNFVNAEKVGRPSRIECSQVEENGSR
ncbi:hypothetical protein Adt_43378 [Abeliophyllum distichum]|uniref:DUF632 domain-containing protein n=1 Tax=Abeliophyllum distichum TaxID=126358 RepID=A0ABD1P7W7_9LAMI